MIDVRLFRSDAEIDAARKLLELLEPEAVDPEWGQTFAVLENAQVVGLFHPTVRVLGLQLILQVTPMLIARPSVASFVAFGWVDARMRSIAETNHFPGYHFTIKDTNRRFQSLTEKHFPVMWIQADGERHYYRQFN